MASDNNTTIFLKDSSHQYNVSQALNDVVKAFKLIDTLDERYPAIYKTTYFYF